jgi:hypothetical protein
VRSELGDEEKTKTMGERGAQRASWTTREGRKKTEKKRKNRPPKLTKNLLNS